MTTDQKLKIIKRLNGERKMFCYFMAANYVWVLLCILWLSFSKETIAASFSTLSTCILCAAVGSAFLAVTVLLRIAVAILTDDL